MSIAFDVITPNGGNVAGSSPQSYSHAGGATLTNGVLVVWAMCNQRGGGTGAALTSATYNSVSTTAFGASVTQASGIMRGWGLIAPAAGTKTVAVTFTPSTSADPMEVISMTYTGVDQAVGFQNYNSAKGTSTGPATVTITSATGNLVVGAAIVAEANVALTISGGTSRAAANRLVNGDNMYYAAGEFTGSASVAAAWTFPSSTVAWIAMGVDLIVASGGGGGAPLIVPEAIGFAAVGGLH